MFMYIVSEWEVPKIQFVELATTGPDPKAHYN